MILAAKSNSIQIVDILISLGETLDLNFQERKGGNTALMLACFEGHINVVRSLIAAGASIDVVDRVGLSDLDIFDLRSGETMHYTEQLEQDMVTLWQN